VQQEGKDASDSLDQNGLAALVEAMVAHQWTEGTDEGVSADFYVCTGTGRSDWHRPRPDEWIASLCRLLRCVGSCCGCV